MNRPAATTPHNRRTVIAALALLLGGISLLGAQSGTASESGTAHAKAASVVAQFYNPIADTPDPTIVTDGGFYYLIGTSQPDWENKLYIRKSTTIAGLRTATPVVVWTGTTSGLGCCRLWSPVLEKVQGTWYIYLSVTDNAGSSVNQAAVYALQGNATDPLGPYTLKAAVKTKTGPFTASNPWEKGIVGPSVLALPDGRLFLTTTTFGFYIQQMSNPWTLTGSMVTVDEGDRAIAGVQSYPWEGGTREISRPFFKTVGAQTKVFLPYTSENHVRHWTNGAPCWSFCIGMFTNTDGYLLTPASWTRSAQPVFAGGTNSGIMRILALATFKSPDGTQDWMVYNASDSPGTDFGERDTFVQPFTFAGDGTPQFGTPVPLSQAQNVPSGEVGSPPAYAPDTTLYTTDFASGATGWAPATGSWTACSGQYCSTGATDNLSLVGQIAWSDYYVQAKVTPDNKLNGSGVNVVARAQASNKFYNFELLKDGAGVEKWVIAVNRSGTYTILASGTYAWSAGTAYTMRLWGSAGKLAASISLDGGNLWTELGEVREQDTTGYLGGEQPTYNYGQAGLRSWGGVTAHFDDVKVVSVRPTYGFYAAEGWQGLTINAGAIAPNPNEGYCVNSWNEYCLGGYDFLTTATISTSGVANALPAIDYQTERWNDSNPGTARNDGSFRYMIPSLVPGRSYMIRLHFAEIYYTAVNQRKFDVSINGTLVLDEFDKVAAAGAANKAVVRDFVATADSHGDVLVAFLPGSTAGVDHNPTVSAVQVLPYQVHINAGGPAVGNYVADTGFTGGFTSSTASTVSTAGVVAPAPAAAYQTQRYNFGAPGDFHYSAAGLITGSQYRVRLHFAEIYYSAAGQRKFNVSINGTPVLTAFDVVAAAGGALKAVVREFTATANASGVIDIDFTQGGISGIDGNPVVNAVEFVSP